MNIWIENDLTFMHVAIGVYTKKNMHIHHWKFSKTTYGSLYIGVEAIFHYTKVKVQNNHKLSYQVLLIKPKHITIVFCFGQVPKCQMLVHV
jgi:hypothetical protein